MMLSAISADEYKHIINKRWNLIQPPEPSETENLKIGAKDSPKVSESISKKGTNM